MISVGYAQEMACLSSDLENAKICSQASCRRVANHCSNLLDAVLIFKTWFIQRQSDISHSTSELDVKSNGECSILPYNNNNNTIMNGQQPMLHNQINQHSANIERDWAIMHAKRAESQLIRLRNSVVGMRAQLQAGLRHKLECEQLRKDLEMHKDTISHYQNIINEGNRLRDDLREELARVRKEVVISRSRLATATAQRPINSPVTSTLHVPTNRVAFDEVDTMATAMMAMADNPELSHLCNLPPQDVIIQLRTQIEHRIRFSESLKSEVENLKETIRGMLEKEVAQSIMINSLRTEFKTLVKPVWHLLQKHYDLSQMKSLNAILNINCITRIAKLLTIPIPDYVIMELSQFNDSQSIVTSSDSQKSPRKTSQSINHSILSESPQKLVDKSNDNILHINNNNSSPSKSSIDQSVFEMNNSFNTQSSADKTNQLPIISPNEVDLDESGQDEMIKNDTSCELDKVELMSVYSSSGSSRCGSLKFPDVSSSSDDDDDDGAFNNDENKSFENNNNNNNNDNNNNKSLQESCEDLFEDQNVITQSPLHQENITTSELNISIGDLEEESVNISSSSNHASCSPTILKDVQFEKNIVPDLQVKHVEDNTQSSQQHLISLEVMSSSSGVMEKEKDENETPSCPSTKALNSSRTSKSSEHSHRMVTRSKFKCNSQLADSPLNISSFHTNDNVPVNSYEKLSNSQCKLILENTVTSKKLTKPSSLSSSSSVQQLKSLEKNHKHSKINLTLDDNIPSRVLTCPTMFSRNSNCSPASSSPSFSSSLSLKSDIQLFSLLSNKYSSDILQWCNQLCSLPFLNEIPKLCSNNRISSTPITSPTHLQVPITSVETSQIHSSSPIKSKKLGKLNDQNTTIHQRAVINNKSPAKKLILDCLSETVNDTIITNTDPNNKSDHQYNKIQQKCINFLLSKENSIENAPIDLFNELKQTNIPIQIILSSLNTILTSAEYSHCLVLLKLIDEKFTSLCHAIRIVDHEKEEILSCCQQSTQWLLTACNKFTKIIQFSIASSVIFKLLCNSVNFIQIEWCRQFFIQFISYLFHQPFKQFDFALYLMPNIIDNCLSGFPNLWCDLELLKNDDDDLHSFTSLKINNDGQFSFSYITATLKILLSWQEARECRSACLKSNVQLDCNRMAVYHRLREKGWLPVKTSDSSTRIEAHNLVFSQQTHRIRCLCLRLVDACLNVSRDHISSDDSSTHVMILSNTVVDLDIIYSLRLILSAMAFVVGEEAMVGFYDEKSASVSSKSKNHQRTRRYRQVERHRQHGLLGWLITGRLLPWLTKCLKMKNLSTNTDTLNLIHRLSCLLTDILIYSSHLFKTNHPGEQCNSLKQLIFHAGNQLLHLLTHNKFKEIIIHDQQSSPSSSSSLLSLTYLICCIRLIGFNPKLIIQSISQLSLETINHCIEHINNSNELFTYLWPPSSSSSSSSSSSAQSSSSLSVTHSHLLKHLIEQSIILVNSSSGSDIPVDLLQHYIQTCQLILSKLSCLL
ncbi:unnamed protein product [Schistosoma turkestanicum]|nr:unnamed protein product [Schistosoma turkestanicum]